MQLPIPVCINAPSIADTSLFHKTDTAQFPDTASTTVQHLANCGHLEVHWQIQQVLMGACNYKGNWKQWKEMEPGNGQIVI